MLDNPEFVFLISIIFIIGCFIGSFIGVIIGRMARGEQFVSGRSYCESCKTQLIWKDMVPILSYILLHGKCRYCRQKLSPFLPFIEIISGFILVICFYVSFFNINDQFIFTYAALFKFIYIVLMAYFLTIIFFMDAVYMLIPMIPFYALCVVYLAYNLAFSQGFYMNLEYRLYGFLIMLIFFWGINLFSKGRMMGDGDIFLAAAFGFILGLDASILMWILSFVFGSFYALYLMAFKNAGLKQAVPFGPFLIISYIICVIYADEILAVYFRALT
jgi:leader peptidase (prepilin peptidase)/N-methyltransferase